MTDTQEFRDLCAAIARYYGSDPHLGKPHPETIKAIAYGVDRRIEVSKRRPSLYANEPWMELDECDHSMHAVIHANGAYYGSIHGGAPTWLDRTDGMPNAAHAGLRLDFAMWLRDALPPPTGGSKGEAG